MKINRREFLKNAVVIGGGAAVGGCTFGVPFAAGTQKHEMLPKRTLGTTGEKVTMLGLGGAWLGRKSDAKESYEIIDEALNAGIRYFDTAPNYGKSEERLGEVLQGMRDDVFITTKLDHADAERARSDLEQSLERMKTDHVDLLLQHCVGCGRDSTDKVLSDDGALNVLLDAKKKGLTRYIGFSCHAPQSPLLGGREGRERSLKMLNATDEWDAIMPFVNFTTRAGDDAEKDIIGHARDKGLGVIGMKILGGRPGVLVDEYQLAFRYALSVQGVNCIVIGANKPKEIRQATQAVRNFEPLKEKEMDEAIERGREIIEREKEEGAMLRHHYFGDWSSQVQPA